MTEHIGVLGLQGNVGQHARIMDTLGSRVSVVRRSDDLEGLDGLIIPGGESTTMDKLSKIVGLAAPLQEKIATGLPVYGSCAGMVMLADRIADPQRDVHGEQQRSFGGIDMTVARNAFGRQVDSFETTIRLEGVTDPDRPMPAVFIRAPWVEGFTDNVHVLGRVPLPGFAEVGTVTVGDTNPVVAVRQEKLLATSFHPEVTADYRVHELFLDIIREEA